MFAVRKIVALITLVLMAFGLCLAGCGDGDDGTGETVFIYVLNAYPGSSKLTLYGPTGKVASGLPFGQRTEEAVAVDRNTSSDNFMLLIDGAPTTMDFTKEMFSMYPQETATMVISRRSGEESADTTLFRHTRSFSPSCVATFGNSLSLSNSYMPTELLSYAYQTEWKIEQQTMYQASAETVAETRCGPTAIRPGDIQRRNTEVLSKVDGDPWFFPVAGKDNNYDLVWGVREVDPRTQQPISSGIIRGGQIVARRTSAQFVECMSAAVSVKQEKDEGSGSGDASEEQACPVPSDGARLGSEQVIWDELAVGECFVPPRYTGFPVIPGQTDNSVVFQQQPYQVGNEFVCGHPVRIRTPVQDIIFQNRDNGVPNYIDGKGGFAQFDLQYPMGEQRFFVLYGRPINPFMAQWNSAESSFLSNGEEFPYPGDIAPAYSQP